MSNIDEIDSAVQSDIGISAEDLTAFFLLNSIKGFGPQKFKELWDKGISVAAVANGQAPLPTSGKRGDEFRKQLDMLSQEQRETCRQRATKQIAAAKRNKASIVSYQHADYPRNVLASNNPVPILYVRGSGRTLTTRHAVACVGSRNIRPPYDQLHRAFARTAQSLGFTIVSGFAVGADAIGHRIASLYSRCNC